MEMTEERKNWLRNYFSNKNLSKSEVEVVILVLQGLINKEVANKLCVAEKTIKFHLGNAYKKLKISRRSQLIWTLPLEDFVGQSNKVEIPPQQPRQDSATSHSQQQKESDWVATEERIPSGISTVDHVE